GVVIIPGEAAEERIEVAGRVRYANGVAEEGVVVALRVGGTGEAAEEGVGLARRVGITGGAAEEGVVAALRVGGTGSAAEAGGGLARRIGRACTHTRKHIAVARIAQHAIDADVVLRRRLDDDSRPG